jgi:hypothetical protein
MHHCGNIVDVVVDGKPSCRTAREDHFGGYI